MCVTKHQRQLRFIFFINELSFFWYSYKAITCVGGKTFGSNFFIKCRWLLPAPGAEWVRESIDYLRARCDRVVLSCKGFKYYLNKTSKGTKYFCSSPAGPARAPWPSIVSTVSLDLSHIPAETKVLRLSLLRNKFKKIMFFLTLANLLMICLVFF